MDTSQAKPLHPQGSISPTERTQSWAGVATTFPVDLSRGLHPIREIGIDLVRPAVQSDWHALVAHTRIRYFDVLRPYLVRAFLLLTMALTLALSVLPSRWVWLGLLPSFVQTTLEIYLNRYTRNGTLPHFTVLRALTRMVNWSYDKTILNFTGLTGAVACPVNIVLLAFAIGPERPYWIKLGGFVASLLYLNSSLVSLFLDVSHYSIRRRLPGLLPHLRAGSWLLAVAFVETVVMTSAAAYLWHPDMTPVALMAGLLPMALGSRLRDHDRIVEAAARVAKPAVTAGRSRLRQDVHDLGNKAKFVARHLRAMDSISPDIKEIAETVPIMLSTLEYLVDEEEWANSGGLIPLQVWASKSVADHQIDLTVVDLAPDLGAQDRELCRQFVTTCLLNVVQELLRTEQAMPSRAVSVRACIASGHLIVEIEDPLPLIPESRWLRPNTTMGLFAARIQDQFGGSMIQISSGSGKVVRATWPLMRPALAIMASGDHLTSSAQR